ncbi:MAG: serine hydrolase [Bryobacterales bacterium]|nr:serine hydrolase [Bryobacterales bacterium]
MIRFLICSLCLAAGLCSFTLFAQTTPDLTPLDEIADRAAFEMQTDLDLVVLHRGEVVYRKQTTGHGGVGAIGIASASKWLAAATMQSMVEDGLLSWDDPAGLYLYYFRDDKAGITLRDLFSHTSGMASSFACLQERSKTIDECVQTIAGQPLLYPPGTAFHYGDASFQVGARAAETVTARFWEDLFQRRIAQPLGMRFTTFQPDGATFNPDVAAGAFSVADDYLRFLEMLVAGGEWEGRRILSRRSLDLMFADQTRGTRIASSFYAADEGIRPGAVRNRYGLGNWLEGAVDGVSEGNSSPGAFGVSPYIDRERDFAFLAFLRDPALGFNRFYYEIKDVLNEAFQVPPVSITSEIVERFVVAGSIPEGGPSQRAGGLRRARRYVPAACREETSQCPAVIAMHPDASNGPAFATAAGLVAFAERERVVVELWDGLPAINSGNAATEGEPLYWDLMPDFGAEQGNDARLAVWASQDLAGTVGVDPQRIYLLGFQAGADAAALAACRDPHAFAGMVLVAPTFTLKSAGGDEGEDRVCDSTGRLPVMLWGGLPEAAEADKGTAPSFSCRLRSGLSGTGALPADLQSGPMAGKR